jgi:hypothetical protein
VLGAEKGTGMEEERGAEKRAEREVGTEAEQWGNQ